MNPKKLFIVEQYLSWNGHYKKYFENLISDKYYYIYSSNQPQNYPNSIFLPESDKIRSGNFIDFIKGRFVNSFKCYSKLIDLKPDVAHLVEFEPFSFFYLLLFRKRHIPKLIITVHSIERMKYANKLKDIISSIQRRFYAYTLTNAANQGATFITHYQHHKNQLISLIGSQYEKSIILIQYPCPKLKIHTPQKKDISSQKLLIYGQIREDKGIFEFLSLPGTEKLNITIAGPVLDERILRFKNHNITFFNRYFNEDEAELKHLISTHNFMLLPYLKSYTGGSGTLKDSLSFGLPIIASDIPTFREVIQEGQVGYTFQNVEDILRFSNQITESDYEVLASNCLKYAQKYNWENMRNEYFKIYDSYIH